MRTLAGEGSRRKAEAANRPRRDANAAWPGPNLPGVGTRGGRFAPPRPAPAPRCFAREAHWRDIVPVDSATGWEPNRAEDPDEITRAEGHAQATGVAGPAAEPTPVGRETALALLAATALGLVESMAYIGYALSAGELEYGVSGVLARVVPRWWIWAAFVPVISRHGRSSDLAERPRALAGHLLLGLLLSAAHLALWAGYRQAVGIAAAPFSEDLTRLTVNFLVLDYITFLAIAGVLQVRRLVGGIRARERERARLAVRNASLQTRLAEARLRALASQLRPHFLFNALNAVSELIHEDPAEAERLIARLGDLLRLVLARTERHQVSLREEMEIVDAYLDIERSRFRGRLETRIDMEPAALSVQVPTLSVQPLVENAVRHGVERDRGAGCVTLRGWLENGTLRVAITDDGPGASASDGDGIGLSNTRSRLNELYGGRGSLDVHARPEGGTRALLTIPAGEAAT